MSTETSNRDATSAARRPDDERFGRMMLVYLILAATLAAAYVAAPTGGDVMAAYSYALQVTARITFGFFVLAYVARPLVQVLSVGRSLVRVRRYLGIATAVSHTIHFVYVVLYLRNSGEPLEPLVLAFGGLGFVLFWLMAATSNDRSVRALGPWWRRLHRFGMHYNWIIFTQTFAGAALTSGEASHWLLTLAALGAAGLRLAAYLRRRGATTRSSA